MESSRVKWAPPEIVAPRGDARLKVEEICAVGSDLNVEFRKQAGLYAYVSYNHAQAKSSVRLLETELELLTAMFSSKARRLASLTGERLTKDQVNNKVIIQSKYQQLLNRLEDARLVEDQLWGLAKALEHKRDALVGLSANYRHELPGELRMMAKNLAGQYGKNKTQRRKEEI